FERARSRWGARWIKRTDRHHRTEAARCVPVRTATVSFDRGPAREGHAAGARFQIPACPPVLAARLVEGALRHKQRMGSEVSDAHVSRSFHRTGSSKDGNSSRGRIAAGGKSVHVSTGARPA